MNLVRVFRRPPEVQGHTDPLGIQIRTEPLETQVRTQPLETDDRWLLAEAEEYIALFHRESGIPEVIPLRRASVRAMIARTGMYWHTDEELAYGARVAWRNSSRCIGRLHWQSLRVHDMRDLSTAGEVFEALVEHIRWATNGGKIRSSLTVFAPQEPGQPGIRIWNPQLIRYAGYRQPDGTVIGDPLNIELTEIVQQLGWKGGPGTPFDLLPIVIQMPYQRPVLFELPPEMVLEVPIKHPDYSWFAELDLKWYALPVIANMRMEIGGISYPAAPFNGWYMETEIGARNLADSNRYNMLPVIARRMGLDTRSDRTLWKDQALIELNRAVLDSFAKQGITIVDHHTASRQFIHHEEREKRFGRDIAADWGWIVPPVSGSLCPVFHRSYEDRMEKPNFFYQEAPWSQYM